MKPRSRRDLGPAAVAFLRDSRRLSWLEIAHSLLASARTIRRAHARYHQASNANVEQDRRGRPYADLDAAEGHASLAETAGSGLLVPQAQRHAEVRQRH